jgi:L-asparaginase
MIKEPVPIHFMIMGGTIDSYDTDIPYPSIPFSKSIIPTYIKTLKLDNKTKFTTICLKDSRNISKKDMKKLLEKIKKSNYKHFVITTGTFTMGDVSRYLKQNMKKTKKTIILTGSMIPFYGFSISDAGFNIGYSVSKVQELPNGVYICMNGRIFSPSDVLKIISAGKFVKITDN